jgi:hypothetical protein
MQYPEWIYSIYLCYVHVRQNKFYSDSPVGTSTLSVSDYRRLSYWSVLPILCYYVQKGGGSVFDNRWQQITHAHKWETLRVKSVSITINTYTDSGVEGKSVSKIGWTNLVLCPLVCRSFSLLGICERKHMHLTIYTSSDRIVDKTV